MRHFEAVLDKETGRLFALTDPAAPKDGTLVHCPALANVLDPGPCICGVEPEHYSAEWLARDDERARQREEDRQNALTGYVCMHCGTKQRWKDTFYSGSSGDRCEPCFLKEPRS
jgi:DNA-directed RNA polymerase subunit RPC12/RpoP